VIVGSQLLRDVSQSWPLHAQSELPPSIRSSLGTHATVVVRSYADGSVFYYCYSSSINTTFPLPERTSGRALRPNIKTAPFVLSFKDTRLLILEARNCGPSPRKHNLKYHPRPTRSPGSFGGQRAPWYQKSAGFKTFLGSAFTSLFPWGTLPRGIPGTQHTQETVAFAYCSRLSCPACVLSLHVVTGP
jgi:hypothetical protein